jgi:7-cyano-7-deazaguanine synthase
MIQAAVLFSSGIDSTTALHWALDTFDRVQALTFDYGQRHAVEIPHAEQIAKSLNVPQTVIRVDLKQIGGSSLTDPASPVPDHDEADAVQETLPTTYVPFRNGIFLSLAAAWAEVNNCTEIVCGFNVIDSPDYPDTRKSFVTAMQEAINRGSKAALNLNQVTIHAPFIDMRKSEIIETGLALGVDYSYSISCYAGREIPCAKCPSCRLRQKAWAETGMEDPLYARLGKEGKL